MGFRPDYSTLVNRHYSDLLRKFLINRQFYETDYLYRKRNVVAQIPMYHGIHTLYSKKYQGTNMVHAQQKNGNTLF